MLNQQYPRGAPKLVLPRFGVEVLVRPAKAPASPRVHITSKVAVWGRSVGPHVLDAKMRKTPYQGKKALSRSRHEYFVFTAGRGLTDVASSRALQIMPKQSWREMTPSLTYVLRLLELWYFAGVILGQWFCGQVCFFLSEILRLKSSRPSGRDAFNADASAAVCSEFL